MDFSRVGKKIQELRQYNHMTQAELADGICTQAQISKIENGSIIPYSNTLFQIAEKLGADMYYFFEEAVSERPDYVQDVFDQLEECRFTQDYKQMEALILYEKDNPLFTPPLYKQYIAWHKGIFLYHLYRKTEEAFEQLLFSISIDPNPSFTERKAEISNSLAVFYNLEERYEDAEALCKEALNKWKQMKKRKDPSIEMKLTYTLAISLTKQQRYKESAQWCEKGIKRCLETRTMYVFGELLYQKGRNLLLMGETEKGLEHWNEALGMFKSTRQHHLVDLMDKDMNQFIKDGVLKEIHYE
ncbi:transcriptional regulator with XRE-family HTH domain [Sinobaca qinghaiensis]|uniref:Transcriptional regulator with XRE-family HTH domain n=1 Tax=Sinobaca qinghaiensis TaxID=342944 RepID=A0A419UW45_9BACL|nr:helix-turn-helix domain-containing protein [Sinobaca qinghaiensis]RKD68795.1 transcriptional regulator with XRE-family HTH domain [Sinobaca qinghaiensis]